MKVVLMVMADTASHADRARVANALTTAYEFKEAGDEVDLIFTGAGTKWVGELSDTEHRLHRAFGLVRDEVSGACRACATAFGVREEVETSGVPLLAEYKGHQSLRQRVAQGYQIITF